MSKLEVTINRIERIWEHPDADRLQLAKVEGMDWQFCSQKGLYEEGDEVVYFPVDSLVPDGLAEYLGIKQHLVGKDQDRIKTVKLRGQISQGLVIAMGTIRKYVKETAPDVGWPPENLTETLGIRKYDPPGVDLNGATLMPLPDGLSVYDIENAANYPDVVAQMADRKALVTEKLEGTNFSITIARDGNVMVNQRSGTIIPDEGAENLYWKVAADTGTIDAAKRIWGQSFPGQQLTLYGELVGPGIQKNIYDLKDKRIFWFDVLVDAQYLGADAFIDIMDVFFLDSVPILSRDKTLEEWLDGRSLQDASNGGSAVGKGRCKREGIVIKPFQEDRHGSIGRMIIKQRSPEYLAKTGM